jgi:hypothetical protein
MYLLMPPRVKDRPAPNLVNFGIASSLATRFKRKIADIRAALRGATIEQWGALKRTGFEGGEIIRASSLYKPPTDSRDPTFIRVSCPQICLAHH